MDANNTYLTRAIITKGATNLNEALISAIKMSNSDMIKVLLEAGANNVNEALATLMATTDLVPQIVKISKMLIDAGATDLLEAQLDQNARLNSAEKRKLYQ